MVGSVVIHVTQFFRVESFFNQALNSKTEERQEKADSLKNRILVQQICDKLGIDPTLDFHSKTKLIEQKMSELEKLKDDLIARNIDTAQRASKIQEALEKQLQAQTRMSQLQGNMPVLGNPGAQAEPTVDPSSGGEARREAKGEAKREAPLQEEEEKRAWRPKRQLEMIPPE